MDLINIEEELRIVDPRTLKEKGEAIIRKLASVTDWVKASMVTA